MPDAQLDLSGLNDQLVRVVENSFNLLNKNAGARIISEKNIEYLLAELAEAGINIFFRNSELRNVFQVGDCFYIQVKTLVYTRFLPRSGDGGYPDVNSYFLSQIGYKKLRNDYGVIHIEPAETGVNSVAKFLSHIFSSDDLVIHGHEKFTGKYCIHATDKQQANGIFSDGVLDTISDFENLHISIVRDKLFILAPELNDDSTIAIMKTFEALPV